MNTIQIYHDIFALFECQALEKNKDFVKVGWFQIFDTSNQYKLHTPLITSIVLKDNFHRNACFKTLYSEGPPVSHLVFGLVIPVDILKE